MRLHGISGHIRARLLTLRLNRHLAALQTIEALRDYTADHNGQIPQHLNQLQGVTLPNDPVTQKPFHYELIQGGATLTGPIPAGGRPRDALFYNCG